ncbi:MAG: PAS domain S-box protein [Acidobacteriota bacterium]|nr:PAS domain S-box protein [Acidobacteriota bacterium]
MGKNENTVKSSFDRLAAINRSITTSLNFSEALRLIVVNAAELFSADTSLLLLAEDDGVLRVRAAHGLDNDGIPGFSGPMEESVIRNLSRHLKIAPPKELVTVPIVADGSLNGFLAIVRDSQLTSEEHWQLSALADQAAIALNNARLHEFQTGEAMRQRDETLAALRGSHRKINAILESITDLYYQLDSEWRFVDVNKRVEELFGKSFEELVGKVIWEVYPRAVDSDLYPQFHKAVEQRIPVHFELASKIVDGVWFEAHAYPTKTSLSVYLRDITERKRSDQEIAFQAHLLSAVEQAVIATDLEGTIVYWNSFAELLYGWSATEAVGSNILEVTPADTQREQAQEILSRLKQGRSWSGEFLVRRKDGHVFPVMITDSPIFDAQGKLIGVVGVSVDITERRRAEEERERLHASEREARAEAEKANRLKDEFLATLSHELRNPLNVILGYAEVLLRSEEARASQFVRKAAEILKRNALAQSRLVRDLLDLSRLHIGKLSLNREVVSLMTIINNAVETVGGDVAAKQIELKVEAGEDVIFVNADPLRLEQIIWNLLNNAVKFTPAGGAITIRVRADNDRAVLSVEDTGQGIEPEFLPHVFEMFRQADASSSRPHGGMGIGLALVRQLIDLHGGTIAVDSVVGQGAKFTIQLPVSTETEKSLRVSGPLQAAVLNQMRILVVDDSADTVDMLRRLFEMDGASVDTARSGLEALDIARGKDFDVVLSDISMPGMDGFEFVGRLRQIANQKDVPVIALTGFGRTEDVDRATGEGFLSHVTKPIDVNSLVEILRKLPLRNRQIAANAQT